MTLDLRQLRYFVAVAEERHVTRAAERLGMQQPPLSQQIKALERQLALQLFRRKARGVELTECGEVLLREAQAILARLEEAQRATQRTARGEQGRLCVGVAPTAPFHPFVPGVIRAFREAFPGLHVTLEECLSRQAVQGLRDDRLDAAFVRAAIPDEGGITVHRLIDEPMMVVLPTSHPLAAGRQAQPLDLGELAAESFIAFARVEGPGMFDATLAACLKAGFTPRLGQEAPRITSTLGLVAAGLGIALVPESLHRVQMHGLVYRDLAIEGRPTVPIELATRRGGASVVVRNFVDLVRRIARVEGLTGGRPASPAPMP